VFQYRYYVLVTDGFSRESPYALVRARRAEPPTALVDFFTPDSGWKQSSRFTLEILGAGAVPISGLEVKRYERVLAQRLADVEAKGYQYYFIIDSGDSMEHPGAVIRKQDTGFELTGEETFTTDLEWVRSDKLYRISSGREYYDAVPVSEEQAMAHVAWMTKVVEERESNGGQDSNNPRS
jgi:hypothetical protein